MHPRTRKSSGKRPEAAFELNSRLPDRQGHAFKSFLPGIFFCSSNFLTLQLAAATAKHKLAGAHLCSAGPRRLTGAGTRTRSTDTAHANVDCQHTSTVRLSSRPQHARGNTPRDNRQPNRWAPTSAGMGALVGRDFLHTHRENSKKSPLRGAPFPAHPRGFGGQGAKKTLHISSTFWSRCAAHGRVQMRCDVHPLTKPARRLYVHAGSPWPPH